MENNNISIGEVTIILYDGEEMVKTFSGADQYDALFQLNRAIFESNSSVDAYEGLTFIISGIDKRLSLNTMVFHYCFAKSRITVPQLLDLLQSQEEQ